MPRQPIGSTFIVSICVLGLFAAFQLIAVVVHYIPLIKQQIADAVPPQQAEEASAQSAMPAFTPAPLAPPVQQPGQAVSTADAQRAKQLLADSDRNFRVGQYDAALKPLEEIEEISPGDPAVLSRKVQIFEKLGQPSEAILALDELMRYPGLSPQDRAMLQRKLDLLSQQVSTLPSRPTTTPRGMADATGEAVRQENGLQPGASLGIVTVRLSDGKPGTKNLMVAVKSGEGLSINVQDVKIYVYFYEQDENGEVVITDSKVVPQWLSPPVNWADNGEPELLESQYTLPTDGRKYYGYVVAVYYNKELQDFRAEPAKLARDFEVPLYLKETPEQQ
jgi:hypothetical protein